MESDIRHVRKRKNELRRAIIRVNDELHSELEDSECDKHHVRTIVQDVYNLYEEYSAAMQETQAVYEAYKDLKNVLSLSKERDRVATIIEQMDLSVRDLFMEESMRQTTDKNQEDDDSHDGDDEQEDEKHSEKEGQEHQLPVSQQVTLDKVGELEARLQALKLKDSKPDHLSRFKREDDTEGTRFQQQSYAPEQLPDRLRQTTDRFNPHMYSTPAGGSRRLRETEDHIFGTPRSTREDIHVSYRLPERARSPECQQRGYRYDQERHRPPPPPDLYDNPRHRRESRSYASEFEPTVIAKHSAHEGSMRQREYHEPPGYEQYRASERRSLNPLARMEVPIFTGDDSKFEEWWSDFMGMVHVTDLPVHHKLMRLRRAVTDDAYDVIHGYGESEFSYESALDALWERYGGQQKQINRRMEEINRMKPICEGVSRDIEKLVESLNVLIIKLKESGQTSELMAGFLYSAIQKKIPPALLTRYYKWSDDNSFEESVITLRKFMSMEARHAVRAAEASRGYEAPAKKPNRREERSRTLHTQAQPTSTGRSPGGATAPERPKYTEGCGMCKGPHGVWKCDKFKALSVTQRWAKATEARLCFRCLGTRHRGEACSNSRSCGVDGCKNTHHRMLHDERGKRVTGVTHVQPAHTEKDSQPRAEAPRSARDAEQPAAAETQKKSPAENRTHMTCHMSHASTPYIALRTVPVVLTNGTRSICVHALLDDASTKTYLNADVAKLLGLQEEPAELQVNTLNNMKSVLKTSTVDVSVENVTGDYMHQLHAYTTQRVTGQMTVVDWRANAHKWKHLKGLEFPALGKRPIVDILIGADAVGCHDPLQEQPGAPGEPVAHLTHFGWTCVGPVQAMKQPDSTNFTFFTLGNAALLSAMERMWSVEEPEACDIVRPDEKHAMLIAETTLSHDGERYKIGLPWKPGATQLHLNMEMARSRLLQTEKKLLHDDNAALLYKEVMTTYEEKGYIRCVTKQKDLDATRWLLPHFPIIKLDRTTTKLRVVFDGSAKYMGASLNDKLLIGPKLQADLIHVLTRFRKYPIAIACDIQEMYMQIEIEEKDRPYMRFLWWDLDQNRKMKVYEIGRNLFGLGTSPFIAHYVSHDNAKKNLAIMPAAADTVLNSTYMDDSLDSVRTVKEGLALYEELVMLWKKAGMNARKWISNSPELLTAIPMSERNAKVDLDNGELPSLKTLGVMWDAQRDMFTYKVAAVPVIPTTKRGLLSQTATIYDPLGFACPVIVVARIILQHVWLAGLDWDQALGPELQAKVCTWFEDLPQLQRFDVPRACQEIGTVISTQIHLFCDASLDAYGGVAYIRQQYSDNRVTVRLLLAKAKVAPTTAVSVPRLELMGAIVCIRLAEKLKKVYSEDDVSYVYWCDSTDVLYWLRGQSRKFKPFVSNRVGVIQRASEPADWHHIPTDINPADILSRGMAAEELLHSELWATGPPFLKLEADAWPISGPKFDSPASQAPSHHDTFTATAKDVSCPTTASCAQLDQLRLDPTRYSDIKRLIQVLGYVRRFVDNARGPRDRRVIGALSSEEYGDAEYVAIRYTQNQHFPDEVRLIASGKPVKPTSRLSSLCPWMDTNQVLRMDSRLQHAADLSWMAKHPIILPKTAAVTELYVRRAHASTGHGGTNRTLANLSTKFWILSAREAIRAWERACMRCRLLKAAPLTQRMAALPEARTSVPRKAFEYTTVDYAGPFYTRQGRGRVQAKRYLCVFTCMAVRAVHLEMSYSMTTQAFLNALSRMIDRRGCPREITSDNGTNFVGGDNELQALVAAIDKDHVQHSTSCDGIQWRFNPPAAPHFNGVHEALVKSAKRAIRHTLHRAEITDEELLSAITGAERLMNSRPLTYQSSEPRDLGPLTPNNFLVGMVEVEFPPPTVDTTSHSLNNRWRRVQEVLRHFWRRWMQELLPQLGLRAKWRQARRDVCVGDVVLLVAVDTPRGQWPLGRVTATFPGYDGRVRAIDVRTKDGTYRRPIVKVCAIEEID